MADSLATSSAPLYDEILKRLLKRFPNHNIVLAPSAKPRPPPNTYIESAKRRYNETRARNTAALEKVFRRSQATRRFAVLPDDPLLWNCAIERATVVVSSDSGFVHIANALKSPSRVVTFSSGKESEIWRRENQPYVADVGPSYLQLDPAALKRIEDLVDALVLRSPGNP